MNSYLKSQIPKLKCDNCTRGTSHFQCHNCGKNICFLCVLMTVVKGITYTWCSYTCHNQYKNRKAA